MQTRTAAAIFGVLMLLLGGCSTSSEPPAASTTSTPPPVASGPIRGPQQPVVTPLVGSVLAAPVPVPATDGRIHLAYEVQLSNVLAQEVTLTSMVVLDRDVSLLKLAGTARQPDSYPRNHHADIVHRSCAVRRHLGGHRSRQGCGDSGPTGARSGPVSARTEPAAV
ncbi:MAG: hypothetical protein ACXWZ2_10520, partial [Mycobacterium sp.]